MGVTAHKIKVSERRTRQNQSRWIRGMLPERYPQAELFVLVLDSLNIHGNESLYVTYLPKEAQALAGRLKIH